MLFDTLRPRSRLVVLFLTVAFGLAGCTRERREGEKVLRIGVLGPFTGPTARTGEEFKDATRMAFEAAGYKIGDYAVELIWIDSQSDPQKATTAYEEAVIRNQIDVGILNWHSSVAVAVMEISAKHRVPHFFSMGATGIVNEKYRSDPARYGYWMAKGWPVPSKLTGAYVQAIEDAIQRGLWKPARKTAAIWGEDTDWGRSLGAEMRDQLKAASWEVAAEEYLPLTETDYYPLLRRFKDTDISLLVGTSTSPAGMAAFVKQTREIGLKSLVVANGLGWVGEWYSLTGEASDGVLDQIPGWITPQAKRFAEGFEKRWRVTPSPAAAGLAYDYANFSIRIATEALRKYGRIDRETLYRIGQEELMTGNLTYTDGLVMKEYKYTSESAPDPVVGEGKFMFPVLQYKGGRSKVIWPATVKEAELEVP